MRQSTLIHQLRALLAQAEDPNANVAQGEVGNTQTTYEFDLSTGRRSELIGQLRQALYLAESPESTFAEFELLDTGFLFDF